MSDAPPIVEFRGRYAFLSNFWPAEVALPPSLRLGDAPEVYSTSEHAFQACKSLDPRERAKVALEATPQGAKHAGGRHGYITLRPDWNEVRVSVMQRVVAVKFRDSALAEQLAATGTAELVEGNTWGDTFWGVDLKTGRGTNALGKILMQVRDDLTADTDRSTE